jgi:hypothetical protein
MAPSSVIQNVTQLSLPHTTTHPHTLLSGGTIPSDRAAVRSPGAAPGRWCSAPPPPPALGGGDDDLTDWLTCSLSSSGDESITALTLCWLLALSSLSGSGGRGGAARRLMEFLVGVRRMRIEARRYSAGPMRLITGGRKGRVEASAAGTEMGSRGRIGRGGRRRRPRTGATTRQMPPHHSVFRRESSAPLLPPPVAVDHRGPCPGRRL